MTKAAEKLQTLVLCPDDYRLREPLDVRGEPCLMKLSGGDSMAVMHLTVSGPAAPPCAKTRLSP
jgi:hypothetical protein